MDRFVYRFSSWLRSWLVEGASVLLRSTHKSLLTSASHISTSCIVRIPAYLQLTRERRHSRKFVLQCSPAAPSPVVPRFHRCFVFQLEQWTNACSWKVQRYEQSDSTRI